jgi:N-acyl-D-amino-acid deacylase
VLGEYVRQRKVITLAEAVRKMTSLPAKHFRLDGRGSIEAGKAADLIVLNPQTVADKATYERPHAYADGILHVIVNGTPVLRNGEKTGARPGQPLQRSSDVAK